MHSRSARTANLKTEKSLHMTNPCVSSAEMITARATLFGSFLANMLFMQNAWTNGFALTTLARCASVLWRKKAMKKEVKRTKQGLERF
mmetsp:Transcript_52608/g.90323  ORF Transcript_52608/g.90323 Transcript_52608/m.90323 type:complete len:88 (+) Transcript_52608:612-875(+)